MSGLLSHNMLQEILGHNEGFLESKLIRNLLVFWTLSVGFVPTIPGRYIMSMRFLDLVSGICRQGPRLTLGSGLGNLTRNMALVGQR